MELPFQWDDGNFISPFVASSEEYLQRASEWLLEHVLLRAMREWEPAPQQRTAAAVPSATTLHCRLVDLGCGTGTALFFLSQHLATAWERCVGDAAERAGGAFDAQLATTRLNILALGVDLDDALIDEAEQTAKLAPPVECERAAVQYRFLCEDIRQCDLDALFPPSATRSPRQQRADGARLFGQDNAMEDDTHHTHIAAASVLYLYLLPEALEVMKPQLVEIAGPRGWIVMSNQWPIQYMEAEPAQANDAPEEAIDAGACTAGYTVTVTKLNPVRVYIWHPARPDNAMKKD